MDLIDKIIELSAQATRQLPHLETEEATKNALIMPFIQSLGYNVFDPTEVVPEFTADVGTKKGEKVDYAIVQNGVPIILIEAKTSGSTLSINNASQLFRYFTTTDVRFAVLTNGTEYRFYSDLEKPNRMDEKPFLVFDILDVDEKVVAELKKFTKSAFNVDNILSSANELKYKREIRHIIDSEYNSPSEDFVKLLARQVYDGAMRQSVIEEFKEIVKAAFRDFINERIASRLQTAIDSETSTQDIEPVAVDEDMSNSDDNADNGDEIETTRDELDGFYVIRAILREVVEVERVALRDVRSYCGILLDDNNRQPIARLHFNRSQKYLGLFKEKSEDRVAIDTVDDIYQYADRLKATVQEYIAE